MNTTELLPCPRCNGRGIDPNEPPGEDAPCWLCKGSGKSHPTPPASEPSEPTSIKWPTEKQLVDVAILFNDGELDADKLGDMVGMSMFILDRLRENGDVKVPSSKELTDNE